MRIHSVDHQLMRLPSVDHQLMRLPSVDHQLMRLPSVCSDGIAPFQPGAEARTAFDAALQLEPKNKRFVSVSSEQCAASSK